MTKLKHLHKYKASGYRKDGMLTVDYLIDTTKFSEYSPTAIFGEIHYYDEEELHFL